MSRGGQIKVALTPDEEVGLVEADASGPDIVSLPDKAVLDAGIAEFHKWAAFHWPLGRPTADEKFKLVSFDPKNDYHIRVTLGMVFMAMTRAAQGDG